MPTVNRPCTAFMRKRVVTKRRGRIGSVSEYNELDVATALLVTVSTDSTSTVYSQPQLNQTKLSLTDGEEIGNIHTREIKTGPK